MPTAEAHRVDEDTAGQKHSQAEQPQPSRHRATPFDASAACTSSLQLLVFQGFPEPAVRPATCLVML